MMFVSLVGSLVPGLEKCDGGSEFTQLARGSASLLPGTVTYDMYVGMKVEKIWQLCSR